MSPSQNWFQNIIARNIKSAEDFCAKRGVRRRNIRDRDAVTMAVITLTFPMEYAYFNGNNRGVIMRNIRIPVLIAAALLAAVNCPTSGWGIPVSELTDPGKAFKEYEAESPSIKYLHYEQSYPAAESRFGHAGVLTADGAIQQGGYFLRYITNSPMTKYETVCGLSSESEWSQAVLDWQDVCYGPRQFWTNYPGSINFFQLQELRTVACFGLPRLAAGYDNFIWTSQTNFEFDHPWGHCAGHIIRFDSHSRPAEIEYHSVTNTANRWRQCYITYSYDSETNFIPGSFIIDGQMRNRTWSTTCGIDTLEIGTNAHATNGYFLKDFLPPNAPINATYFMSNLVRYTVQPDGTKVLYVYPSPLKPGDVAPDFVTTTVDGRTLKLADFRGKYVLLDFWATWCRPCVAETPNLKAVYDTFGKDDRFMMVSLSLDADPSKAKKFMQNHDIGWPQVVVSRSDDKWMQKYGYGRGIPMIFLIGPDGRLLATDLRGAKIKEVVAAALAR